ncbi:MAG: methylenetetrahydrofolate reductase [Bradyrhizobiaceae bacterium]|nr:methylenetetrahydrofolate reductase [Bradyrhizobiaceae bacterium]
MNKREPNIVGVSGQFERALRDGRFVVTAEVTPPVSCDRNDLLAKALPLRGYADAVNVTDGAGARTHMSSVASAFILQENGIEPIMQFTCRDRNRIALQNDLLGAAALGLRNLLVLRGDDPKQGDQPEAKPVFDLDSRTLIETVVSIRDRGELLHGRKVSGKAQFFVGAAEAPVDPPADWQPKGLLGKIRSGAQFAQTQFCMDAGVVRRYTQRIAEAGVPEDFYLLIGVAPLRSAKSGRWMKNNLFGTIIPEWMIERMEKAADPMQEGRKICVELLEELAEIPGVAGAHIMAPNHEEAIPEVIAAFGTRQRKPRGATAAASADRRMPQIYPD